MHWGSVDPWLTPLLLFSELCPQAGPRLPMEADRYGGLCNLFDFSVALHIQSPPAKGPFQFFRLDVFL